MQTYRSTPRFRSKRAQRTWLAARELWQETEFSTRRVEMDDYFRIASEATAILRRALEPPCQDCWAVDGKYRHRYGPNLRPCPCDCHRQPDWEEQARALLARIDGHD